jgi:hypothetical protein
VPRLGDPHPCDFECAVASDHAFRLCCREPRTDQLDQLPDREAVRQHDRLGAAVRTRSKEFQRAPAVGLGAAPAAWGWHLYLPSDQRHGLFHCGAFIAARSHRPSINVRKRPPNMTANMLCDRDRLGAHLKYFCCVLCLPHAAALLKRGNIGRISCGSGGLTQIARGVQFCISLRTLANQSDFSKHQHFASREIESETRSRAKARHNALYCRAARLRSRSCIIDSEAAACGDDIGCPMPPAEALSFRGSAALSVSSATQC